MAKLRSLKNSFIAGEIGNSALGRTDLPQYVHACKILRNALPLLSGGVYRRPGTLYEYSGSSITMNSAYRLFPFVYSTTESYMLAMNKQLGGNGFVTSYRATSNRGQDVTQGSTLYGTTIPYLVPGEASTYVDDEVWDVHYAQSADVMWIVHPGYKPRKICRRGPDDFNIVPFDYEPSNLRYEGAQFRDAWAYLPMNTTLATLEIDVATVGTGRTLTMTNATPDTLFQAGHVGTVFKVNNGGTIGCVLITAIVSSTIATCEVIVAFGAAATPVTTWWEGAWSDVRGWPRTVGFYGGRLVMGGTVYQPDTLFFSETSDYAQFSKDTRQNAGVANGATGSEAFTATLASNQLNQIQWISPESTLLVGTSGEEWIIDYDRTNSAGLGADNIYTSVTSRYGSVHVQPARAGNELFFITQSGAEVRALVFNDNEKSYVGEPVQVLHDEFPQMEFGSLSTNGRRLIRTIQWDVDRSTLWCLDTVGNLRGLTRERRLNISMWHSHQFGGYDSTKTGGIPYAEGPSVPTYLASDPAYSVPSGSPVSLTVIPNPLSGGTDVWFCFKRYLSGAYTWTFERMVGKNPGFDTVFRSIGYGSNPSSVLNFSDCSATYTNYIGVGFPFDRSAHLDGETLVGTAHNADHGLFKITGNYTNGITGAKPPNYLTKLYSANAGLAFTTIIEPVRVEAGSQIGSSVGAVQRIHQATIRFFRTIGCRMGSSEASLETIIFRRPGDLMGKSAELYSGEKVLKLTSDYDRDGSVYITQPDPLPFCVVSISVEGMTGD